MSGIAAIIRFDGGDVEPGAIEAMTAEMAYRGPDGIAHWRQGQAALGHCALHTTAESFEAAQPLANDDESIILVLDGWLHNYDALRGDLLARGVNLRSRSDAELVLRAYEVWGEDCPVHLEGEFAFVVWDRRRNAAFCARDHAGLKPLTYHWDDNRLIIASDPGPILITPGVKREANNRMVAQVFANEWITRGETIWKDVMRLLPATWSRFGPNSRHDCTYWSPPTEVTITYKRDEDYYEHYRELFADCVRGASRSHLPVSADVSGGLDSSAVFAQAEYLHQAGRLPAPGLKGYTYKFEEGSAPDEIEYARAVAAHLGVAVREIAPFIPELDWFTARGRADRDMAPYPNTAMAVAIGDAVVGDGSRVLMNGEGGDEWLGGKPFYYNEQLRAWDLASAAKSFAADRAAIGLRQALYRLIRFGIAPLAPKSLLALRRKINLAKGPNTYGNAFWISPELDRLLTELRVGRDRSGYLSISNMARRAMFMALKEPYCELARDHFDRQCARQGYEPRTPMYARKFIEFAFSTPERLRLQGDTRKYLHVMALDGMLPELVLQRKTKADFSLAFEHHLDKMKYLLTDVLPATGTGHLDSEGVAKLYESYRQLPVDERPVWELWGLFSCESLFQADASI